MPLPDQFCMMPFRDVGLISNDPLDPSPSFTTGGIWLRELDDTTIDILIQYGATNGLTKAGPCPLLITGIRHLGGAIARSVPDTHAFWHRDRDTALLVSMISLAPTADIRHALEDYTRQFQAAPRPHLARGVYMNFLQGEEKWAHTRDAYLPETYSRLTALKARYDPGNVFRFSFDISPVAGESGE